MKTAPTATPLTTVAARKRGSDAAERPATIRASAARNTVSPASITGRVGSLDPPSWMQAATEKARKTTAPATAWLVSCSAPTRKVGTSALNSPSRENAAKPANPAAMNSAPPAWDPEAAEPQGKRGPRAHRFRHDQQAEPGRRHQPELHQERKHRRIGRVLGQQPGQQRAESEASQVGRRRDQRRTAPRAGLSRLGQRGGGRTSHQPGRQAGEHPPDEQPADTRREDERHRADDAQTDRRRQHRTPANLVGRAPREQQRGEHGDRVRGRRSAL